MEVFVDEEDQVVKIIRCQKKKTSNKKPSAKFVALPIAVKGDGFTIILPGLGLEYTHIHLKGGVLFVQIGLFGAM